MNDLTGFDKSFLRGGVVFCFYVIFLFFPVPAHAYIDLGTGSYVVQVIIATVLGMLFALKMYFKKFIDFFRKFKK